MAQGRGEIKVQTTRRTDGRLTSTIKLIGYEEGYLHYLATTMRWYDQSPGIQTIGHKLLGTLGPPLVTSHPDNDDTSP